MPKDPLAQKLFRRLVFEAVIARNAMKPSAPARVARRAAARPAKRRATRAAKKATHRKSKSSHRK
jgi:hypothetical protein